MTPHDLQNWRKLLKLNKAQAARRLGISYAMYRYYEAGQRETGPVRIPDHIALACSAVACGLPPWPIEPPKPETSTHQTDGGE